MKSFFILLYTSFFALFSYAGNVKDTPCYDQIAKQMKAKNFFENSSLNKRISTSEEFVGGKSEFVLFDGTTAARLGYDKRRDGKSGAKLVLSRYDLLNELQELVYIYAANCEIDTLKYNGISVSKSQCEDLQKLNLEANGALIKAGKLLASKMTCNSAVQLQKICSELTGHYVGQEKSGTLPIKGKKSAR